MTITICGMSPRQVLEMLRSDDIDMHTEFNYASRLQLYAWAGLAKLAVAYSERPLDFPPKHIADLIEPRLEQIMIDEVAKRLA